MDAESRKRRRDSSLSLRENRWSMSSQRLEQIVAALMKPVSHHGQSFDRDDAGLLEEYLTTAGLAALAAVEEGAHPPAPNYAEVGMLLQSYANNYSRKVDHLCKMASNFSCELSGFDALEASPSQDIESAERAGRRRAPHAPPAGELAFEPIELAPAAGARRGAGPAGPPPTLPRLYAELQPRAPARADRALADYDGEPIGAIEDFHVTWRLQDGYLVESLEAEGGAGEEARLPPLSLLELQEACSRGAPEEPLYSADVPPLSPASGAAPSPAPSPAPPPAALKRKRPSAVCLEDLLPGHIKLEVDKETWSQRCSSEYQLSSGWIRRVVRHRCDIIHTVRRELPPPPTEFRGFDTSWMDIGGFLGWTGAEAAAARRAAQRGEAALLDSEHAAALDSGLGYEVDHSDHGARGLSPEPWQAGVARRAAQTVPLDLRALGRDVRRALPAPPAAVPWRQLVLDVRVAQPQPARVLLDLLMKATSGQYEILPGAVLGVGDFSVRVATAPPPAPADREWRAMAGLPPADGP